MIGRECRHCEFWNQTDSGEDIGECKYNLPSSPEDSFPTMAGYGWCGQYKPNKEILGNNTCINCGKWYFIDDGKGNGSCRVFGQCRKKPPVLPKEKAIGGRVLSFIDIDSDRATSDKHCAFPLSNRFSYCSEFKVK